MPAYCILHRCETYSLGSRAPVLCAPAGASRYWTSASTAYSRAFPADALAAFDVEVKHPDDFVLESIDIAPGLVTHLVSEQVSALRKPPRTLPELLDTLSGLGLVRSVVALRELL